MQTHYVTRWHRLEHNSIHFSVEIMMFPMDIMDTATIVVLYSVILFGILTNDSINVTSAHRVCSFILLFTHIHLIKKQL